VHQGPKGTRAPRQPRLWVCDRDLAGLNKFLTASELQLRSEDRVMDAIYVGLAVGFFALTWLLVKLCARV